MNKRECVWLYAASIGALLFVACSSSNPPQSSAAPASATNWASVADPQTAACDASGRLGSLWHTRRSEGDSYDYPIGPGDVVEVSAADLPELSSVDARVDGSGTIGLPLLGDQRVEGLTEAQTKEILTEKIKKFQREPRVHVFVKHYASRNVEVMGMVAQPGTYSLNGPGETLLSVIGRAGGAKGVGDERAAERVILFPGNEHSGVGVGEATKSNAPPAPALPTQARGMSAVAEPTPRYDRQNLVRVSATNQINQPTSGGASVDPLVIDLSNPGMAGCLNLPARPGDILLVPPAGQVGVYGWVSHPGSFSVTAGMTVLGAVTAAGGAMFSSNAELLRTEHGKRNSIPLDLSGIESGSSPDLPVQGGDVILIKSSAVGAVPYAVYTLFSKFGTGLYLAPAAGL
jgi:polysaccharide biosynthesis/export protein